VDGKDDKRVRVARANPSGACTVDCRRSYNIGRGRTRVRDGPNSGKERELAGSIGKPKPFELRSETWTSTNNPPEIVCPRETIKRTSVHSKAYDRVVEGQKERVISRLYGETQWRDLCRKV